MERLESDMKKRVDESQAAQNKQDELVSKLQLKLMQVVAQKASDLSRPKTPS